jgi:hypothetical protein
MTNLPVPVPAQETPGVLITSALWNAQVFNGLTYMLNRPMFSGYQATAQSLTSGIWAALNIDTEVVDNYNGHSTTTNPSRYTPGVPGTYLVIGTVGFAGSATGYRRVRLMLNGSLIKGTGSHIGAPGDTNTVGLTTATFVACNGTSDYIEVQASAGAAVNTTANTDFAPSLRVIWISN